MRKFEENLLSDEEITKIKTFINQKVGDLRSICVNKLLRDDIFLLLDKYCTVIYYPTTDMENNGFHVKYTVNNKSEHFVYINTKQHKEKQIFTAAHELGHIWEIEKEFLDIDYEKEECVVNRFASELLMPESHFIEFIHPEFSKYTTPEGKISEIDFIKVITATMNYFYTSFKSVIYRLYELNMIDKKSARNFWEDTTNHTSRKILETSEKIAKEYGYNRLFQTDEHKTIVGLKELLDKAQKLDNLSADWVTSFNEKFGFGELSEVKNFNKKITISEVIK